MISIAEVNYSSCTLPLPQESFNGEVGDLRKRFVQQCLQDLQRSVVPWPLVFLSPRGELGEI